MATGHRVVRFSKSFWNSLTFVLFCGFFCAIGEFYLVCALDLGSDLLYGGGRTPMVDLTRLSSVGVSSRSNWYFGLWRKVPISTSGIEKCVTVGAVKAAPSLRNPKILRLCRCFEKPHTALRQTYRYHTGQQQYPV